MYTYNMRISKDQPMLVMIRIRCEGLVEGVAGFESVPEAFEWLAEHRKKYGQVK